MTVHRFPALWFSYAKSPHQFLVRKWFEEAGIEFDEGRAIKEKWEWDSQTRVLTAGNFQTVTRTPPPWPFR